MRIFPNQHAIHFFSFHKFCFRVRIIYFIPFIGLRHLLLALFMMAKHKRSHFARDLSCVLVVNVICTLSTIIQKTMDRRFVCCTTVGCACPIESFGLCPLHMSIEYSQLLFTMKNARAIRDYYNHIV